MVVDPTVVDLGMSFTLDKALKEGHYVRIYIYICGPNLGPYISITLRPSPNRFQSILGLRPYVDLVHLILGLLNHAKKVWQKGGKGKGSTS